MKCPRCDFEFEQDDYEEKPFSLEEGRAIAEAQFIMEDFKLAS